MKATSVQTNRRQINRLQAVLPVRVRGIDRAGASFEGLAHTLDLSPNGVRLGAIHHEVKALDSITILFRQRRIEFTVIWTKRLAEKGEYQVGLRAVAQGNESWGVNLFNLAVRPGAGASASRGA